VDDLDLDLDLDRTSTPQDERRLDTWHYRGNVYAMVIAHSKLTSQGQVSIPAEVRRRLGLGPGSIVEWDEAGEAIVVRRAGRYSFADVRAALFPHGTGPARSLEDLKSGIRSYIKGRHAGR
jgi:AbrB family looped-hinge helix DNA binding protein